MFPLTHPHKKNHVDSDQEKVEVRQSDLENGCSINYTHSMKSVEGYHCTETSCPCEHLRVHLPVRGEVFFHENQGIILPRQYAIMYDPVR
jgi:hypothetical protein